MPWSSCQDEEGDREELVITASDRDHGFKLDTFHLDQKLPKGEPGIKYCEDSEKPNAKTGDLSGS